MKVVLIGFGSSGKRHVKNLINMGIRNIILFRRLKKGNEFNLNEISDFDEIIRINPDFVIVSNPTAFHFETLKFLIINKFNILCEKPLLNKLEEWVLLKELMKDYNGISRIFFNLRFHPCILKANDLIQNNYIGKLYSARFFVGQYLPDWRPHTNHLESYSAKKKMGGGVVNDLVHEIDIAEYLISKPQEMIHSMAIKLSDLTYDSEDIAEIIYKTKNNVLVNIHLDYLYRGYSRDFLIIGSNYNLHSDLFKNTIKITGDNNQIIESFQFENFEMNHMYAEALDDYINLLNGNVTESKLPTFFENESVMKTCFKINN